MTRTARRIARPLALLVAAYASAATATPNVPLEDPVYLQLEQLRAQGKLPAYLGLPADALVPARIVLTRRSFEQVRERLRSPGEPSKELRDLMRGDRD